MPTCNCLDLETLKCRLILPKISLNINERTPHSCNRYTLKYPKWLPRAQISLAIVTF